MYSIGKIYRAFPAVDTAFGSTLAMGSGAGKAKSEPKPPEFDVRLSDSVIGRARRGNDGYQDQFFDELSHLAASGQPAALQNLISRWDDCVKKHGAREATVAAAKNGQADCLRVLLDEGVRPFIGRNDPEVNPLIHAVEIQSWECVELLVPRSLKYDFSTRLLQEGMLPFVIAGDLDMVSKCVLSHKIPGGAETKNSEVPFLLKFVAFNSQNVFVVQSCVSCGDVDTSKVWSKIDPEEAASSFAPPW